jgi:hypothetical protein
MPAGFPRKIYPKLIALAIYQIAGGVLGIALICWFLVTRFPVPGLIVLIFSIGLGLFIFSIYSGIILLRRKEYGLKPSLINQFLQLVNIEVFGFGFKYVSGIITYVGINWTNTLIIRLRYDFSGFLLNINNESEVVIINFNFFALFLILFIDRLMKRAKENKLLTEASQLGD